MPVTTSYHQLPPVTTSYHQLRTVIIVMYCTVTLFFLFNKKNKTVVTINYHQLPPGIYSNDCNVLYIIFFIE